MIGGRLKFWRVTDWRTVLELFFGLLFETVVATVMGVIFSDFLLWTILLSSAE